MSEYSIERLQGESFIDYKMRLCVAKLNKDHDLDWSEIINMLNLDCSSDHLRKLSYAYREIHEENNRKSLETVTDENINYKETIEILKDGTQKSDKLLKMSAEQSKSVDYLLQAHGFDSKEWELVSARNNIWNVNSKSQGVQTLYSSKISVKPKKNGFDIDRLIESIGEKVKPIHIKPSIEGDRLLTIPLFDMHFGIADYDHYKEDVAEISRVINSKKWDTIYFVIGQDLLHNDSITHGKTTSGTIIDNVDMVKAWNDADRTYTHLLTLALENSKNVIGEYSQGNHDQMASYGFVRMLEAKFPQVEFNTLPKQRKAFIWNKVFIGTTHGDKGSNRIAKNFLSEFGKQMATCDVVEILAGHIHHQQTKDDFGIVVRNLSTKAKTDDYHDLNGFIGSNKNFQLFEFSEDRMSRIYYI